MQPLQSNFIGAYDKGLTTNKKPWLVPDKAFSSLENAYVWRERVKKREGLELVGRLERNLAAQSLGSTNGSGNFTGNIVTYLNLEPNAEIAPQSLTITIGADIFTDSNPYTGILTGSTGGSGYINYATGAFTIVGGPATTAITATFGYYPSLPVMGISLRDQPNINEEQTIFFDTKYAYIFNGSTFQEWIVGTTWNGNDSDFFYSSNCRGVTPDIRVFFTTNFNNIQNGETTPDP